MTYPTRSLGAAKAITRRRALATPSITRVIWTNSTQPAPVPTSKAAVPTATPKAAAHVGKAYTNKVAIAVSLAVVVAIIIGIMLTWLFMNRRQDRALQGRQEAEQTRRAGPLREPRRSVFCEELDEDDAQPGGDNVHDISTDSNRTTSKSSPTRWSLSMRKNPLSAAAAKAYPLVSILKRTVHASDDDSDARTDSTSVYSTGSPGQRETELPGLKDISTLANSPRQDQPQHESDSNLVDIAVSRVDDETESAKKVRFGAREIREFARTLFSDPSFITEVESTLTRQAEAEDIQADGRTEKREGWEDPRRADLEDDGEDKDDGEDEPGMFLASSYL